MDGMLGMLTVTRRMASGRVDGGDAGTSPAIPRIGSAYGSEAALAGTPSVGNTHNRVDRSGTPGGHRHRHLGTEYGNELREESRAGVLGRAKCAGCSKGRYSGLKGWRWR